jgi:hypothetical protein
MSNYVFGRCGCQYGISIDFRASFCLHATATALSGRKREGGGVLRTENEMRINIKSHPDHK